MKIKVETPGYGRKINPHVSTIFAETFGFGDSYSYVNPYYKKFRDEHPELPAFLADGSPLPKGEWEVKEAWQFYNNPGGYWSDCSQRTAELYCTGTETRQVFIALSGQAEVKTENMENKFKGSPTPWVADYDMQGHSIVVYSDQGIQPHICYSRTCAKDSEVDNANAHLIAAAPELLNQCQHWLSMFREYLESRGEIGKMEIERMEAAITKAIYSQK